MINLTSFIGNKIKSGIIPPQSHQTNHKPSQQSSNHSKKPSYQIQSQNISQRSIGLSTLLDLQNEQEVFGEFNISRIGAKNSFLKHSKRQSNISGSKDVKSQIEQMRERRRALEEKVNKTLRREEYRNKRFEIDEKGKEINSSINESQRRSQMGESQVSLSKSSQKPSIIVEQKSERQTSQRPSQMSYKSSQQSYSSQNVSHESNVYHSYFNQSFRQSTQPTKDAFMSYLQKQMYLLKCQKFIKHMNNFKFRVLIKNMKQYCKMERIIRREEMKLCRFVFVSWKRETREGMQKMAMIEMIRKRVEQKRGMERNKVKQAIVKDEQNKVQANKNSEASIKKTDLAHSKCQLPNNSQIPTHDHSIAQHINIHSIPQKYLQSDSIVQSTPYYYSQLNIQQVSPIKSRPQEEHEIHPSNQASFYSKYSCFTEKKNEHEYEEDYIK